MPISVMPRQTMLSSSRSGLSLFAERFVGRLESAFGSKGRGRSLLGNRHEVAMWSLTMVIRAFVSGLKLSPVGLLARSPNIEPQPDSGHVRTSSSSRLGGVADT